MSNANHTPLGSNRKVFGGHPSLQQPIPLQQTSFVDAMGRQIEKRAVSGACSKCGFEGHLPFQCRNTLPIDGRMLKPIRGSDSSDDGGSDFETPLKREDRLEKRREAKRVKKELKKLKKKEAKKLESKKRKRSYSSSESSDDERSKKRKKQKREKKEKKSKKKRSKRSQSSSSR